MGFIQIFPSSQRGSCIVPKMTRGLPLFLGLLVVLQCSVLSRAECDITKCEIPKHYREVAGCEPAKYAEGDEEKCCPIEYNCEAVSKQDKTKCHYKGKVYNDGEILENDDMPNCRRGCFCREGDFVCAHVECPEQVFNRPAPHCVIQSSRTKCCSESILCEEEKIEKLSTCYMDSKLYRQGEEMYPKDERCFTCICDEKWDNSTAITKNPACEEVDCAIDISFQSDLRMGCVPIYYGEPTCCPIDRKCPKSEDKPIPSLTRTAADPNLKCKFGDHDLMVGDKVTDNNKCVECECVIPPMITCVQKRNC